MINRLVLVGRLTKDPELRSTPSGTYVTSFTLAVDNRDKEKTTSFFPCISFNSQAENVNRYCKKGSLVAIEGRLRQRTYENKDNKQVQVIEVLCDLVQFLDSKKQEEKPSNDYVPNNNIPLSYDDDDLPF